ncbi:hypothetical protein DPMN_070294 [Dreissena polymorpha]|uniref:Uncharacterized protein n=1 Tax=Dreissena polymorpha TaxID=45954 RepID=A0A9D3Z2W8_DREPO|nr:hypothetical protein DPMN_070294 [Dreissena polymorpha]
MRQNCRIPSKFRIIVTFFPTNHLDLADDSECGLDEQDRVRLVLSAAKHRAQICMVRWRRFEGYRSI